MGVRGGQKPKTNGEIGRPVHQLVLNKNEHAWGGERRGCKGKVDKGGAEKNWHFVGGVILGDSEKRNATGE